MDRAGAAVVQAPKMEIDFRQIVERSPRRWWWSLSGLLPPKSMKVFQKTISEGAKRFRDQHVA